MENKIKVSDKFVEIYKNFNVVSQIENMRTLSKKELYLLLLICFDKHSDEDPVSIFNFSSFKDEALLLFDVMDDKDTLGRSDDYIIKELIEESGDKYIETDNIIDFNGNPLPKVLSKDEVRDAKIDIINEK